MTIPKKWTEEETDYLKNNYIDHTCQEIAIVLHRTIRSVQHKYQELQLKRPKKIVKIKKCKHITVLGERKTISEWSKDPRCKVGYFTLKQRLTLGWSEEDAVLKGVVITRKSIAMEIGDKRNRLTLKRKFQKTENNNHTYPYGEFECDCKNKTIVEYRMTSVESEGTKSCGCQKIDMQRERMKNLNFIHGYTKDGRIFQEWCSIIARCYKINNDAYSSYGRRGVRVCEDWKNDYTKFKEWAFNNGYNDSLTIDRIDTHYHYCPENCRWTDEEGQYETQRNNSQIIAFGENKSLLHWTRDSRCKAEIRLIRDRLIQGWSTEEAISHPS